MLIATNIGKNLVMLCQLVDDIIITVEQAAAQLLISVREFLKLKESITY